MSNKFVFPLESVIYANAKEGTCRIEHTKVITGEVNQAYVETMFELMGGSLDDFVKFLEEHDNTEDK